MNTRVMLAVVLAEIIAAALAVVLTGDPRIAIPIMIMPVGFPLIVSAFREALEEYT